MKTPVILLQITCLFLSGCAVGNQYMFKPEGVALPLEMREESVAIGISVVDDRPYVVSGNKPADFVGLQRGGFGNPFNVTTASNEPFAKDVLGVLSEMLASKGYQPEIKVISLSPEELANRLAALNMRRGIHLSIRDWKTDIFTTVSVHYDLRLSVLDETGQILAQSTLQGKDGLGGSTVMPSANGPKASQALSTKLSYLFSDPAVQKALKEW